MVISAKIEKGVHDKVCFCKETLAHIKRELNHYKEELVRRIEKPNKINKCIKKLGDYIKKTDQLIELPDKAAAVASIKTEDISKDKTAIEVTEYTDSKNSTCIGKVNGPSEVNPKGKIQPQ
eukprot:GHVP01020573.1.p1 GENE.GHVP01020573.1~~GHVP01020573.1.p1  ORF type:complete len:121 (-),score=21.06 GHVP01020573.1:249-611(-)